jgi:hypothetical protein
MAGGPDRGPNAAAAAGRLSDRGRASASPTRSRPGPTWRVPSLPLYYRLGRGSRTDDRDPAVGCRVPRKGEHSDSLASGGQLWVRLPSPGPGRSLGGNAAGPAIRPAVCARDRHAAAHQTFADAARDSESRSGVAAPG